MHAKWCDLILNESNAEQQVKVYSGLGVTQTYTVTHDAYALLHPRSQPMGPLGAQWAELPAALMTHTPGSIASSIMHIHGGCHFCRHITART